MRMLAGLKNIFTGIAAFWRENTAISILGFSTVSVIGVAIVAVFLMGRIADNLIKEQAQHDSLALASFLASQLENIEQIAATGELTEDERKLLLGVRQMGRIFLFKLFDGAGRQTLLSENLDKPVKQNGLLSEHNPKAAKVLATGAPSSQLADGRSSPDRPDLYVESYVPVIRNGKRVAIVEVYMDMSEYQDGITQSFSTYGIVISALTIIALIAPMMGIIILMKRLKKQNHELDQARLLAVGAERAKSTFLASMSHELRTPLNAIQGLTQVMIRGDLGPMKHAKYHEYAKDINSSGNHLLSLINDILDISKIELGEKTLDETRFNIAAVIAETVKVVSAWEKGDQLNYCTLGLDQSLMVIGDRRGMAQVVLNLLSNATKFTPPGGTITTSLKHASNGSAIVTVSDTGVGISHQDIHRLMRPFQQAENNAFVANSSGVGLGLALSRAIIQAHGGDIKIDSQVNSGTTVIFSLPPIRVISSSYSDAVEPAEPERQL